MLVVRKFLQFNSIAICIWQTFRVKCRWYIHDSLTD